jgi:hypothetical protein
MARPAIHLAAPSDCWPDDPPATPRTGTELINPVLFARLALRIRRDHPDLAARFEHRILDQALAFLATCAVTTVPIGPSELVDIGWHTFMLDTAPYAAFCDRIAGQFIHHVPDDSLDGAPAGPSIAATIAAITVAGYQIDDDLWTIGAAAECTQCHAGCHDSPTR